MLVPGAPRERLTAGAFVPKDEHDPVAVLEAALRAVNAAEPAETKIRSAQKAGRISGRFAAELQAAALEAGVIDQSESALIDRARELRRRVIMVDDFPGDFGPTEIYQTTRPVTFEALRKTS
jgi:acyl-CoA dehydrogenase